MKTADDSRRGHPSVSRTGAHPRQDSSTVVKPVKKAAWMEFGKSCMKIGLLGLLFCAFYIAVWSGGRTPVPVSGTVTYQDKPLANVNVVCMGKGGAIATGTTDEKGRFAFLTTVSPRDGAFPGEYTVAIAPISSSPKPTAVSYEVPAATTFPSKYLSADTSPLRITVSATEPNQIRLELED
jgi:hypothetical protein